MKLYTKTGDKGTTAMLSGIRIRKSDDRIELIGTLDELNSHLGLVKAAAEKELKEELEAIQTILMVIMSGISDPRNKNYKIDREKVEEIEKEIDRIEQLFSRKKGFVLYGGCELSARLDVARAVARRADRIFSKVKNVHGVHPVSMEYVNRLADYLYIRARYADFLAETGGKREEKKSCVCGHHKEVNKKHQCNCSHHQEDNKKHTGGGKKHGAEHKNGTEYKSKEEISEEEISLLVQKILKDFI